MNGLLDLQHKFQEHLLYSKNAIFNDIVHTEKVSTEIRLSIYSEAYRSRLLEALAANYPILQVYLGHEQFEELGNAYIDNYPSLYRSIRWFGDQLKDFLRENSPYNEYPYLIELANVEWIMTLVFDGPNSEVVSLETLATIPPESWAQMSLVMHPSIHLIPLVWNVVPIWQALAEEETPEELLQAEKPVTWIFWRKNLVNHFCSLAEDEAAALDAAVKGNSFADICEVLCDFLEEEEVALRAASLFKGWISAGLIAQINY